jgi:hypothetical protein
MNEMGNEREGEVGKGRREDKARKERNVREAGMSKVGKRIDGGEG